MLAAPGAAAASGDAAPTSLQHSSYQRHLFQELTCVVQSAVHEGQYDHAAVLLAGLPHMLTWFCEAVKRYQKLLAAGV